MLLTVLVFFNGPRVDDGATVSRARLWLALLFLFAHRGGIPGVQHAEPGPAHPAPDAKEAEDAPRLAGTPFETMPDRPRRVPLSRPERVNVVFVLALSQIAQVLTVAVVDRSASSSCSD